MSKTFYLEIITPRQTIFTGEIIDFTAPGVLGRFEILKDHTAFITAIILGDIRVRLENGEDEHYAVGGGFVEVNQNKINCLAESCEKADLIDVVRAKEAMERARYRLEDRDHFDQERCLRSVQRARNRLDIARKYSRNGVF